MLASGWVWVGSLLFSHSDPSSHIFLKVSHLLFITSELKSSFLKLLFRRMLSIKKGFTSLFCRSPPPGAVREHCSLARFSSFFLFFSSFSIFFTLISCFLLHSHWCTGVLVFIGVLVWVLDPFDCWSHGGLPELRQLLHLGYEICRNPLNPAGQMHKYIYATA